MDGGIILAIGTFVTLGIAATVVKHRQNKEKKRIQQLERMEKEAILRKLEQSWSKFEANRNTKVRPSIRKDSHITWNEETRQAKDAWDKITENNKYIKNK